MRSETLGHARLSTTYLLCFYTTCVLSVSDLSASHPSSLICIYHLTLPPSLL